MAVSDKIRWSKKIFLHNGVLPEQVTFFVTNRCNMNCQHCFYRQNLNKANVEFTLDELKRIIPSLGRFSFLSLTGGEPFLREDLSEIAGLFVNINKVARISIPTNGFFTEKIFDSTRKILKIAGKTKILVKISIDGIGEKHDNIRAIDGSFNKDIETFTVLKGLKQKYPNFKLGILLTFSKLNQDTLSDTYTYIKNNLSPDVVGLNFSRRNFTDSSTNDINIADYQKLYFQILNDLLKEKKNGFGFYEFYSAYKTKISELVTEIVNTKKYPIDCYAGRLSTVIDSSLDVYPCESLDKKLGNLRDYDYNFRSLWFSDAAEKTREYIADGRCWCTNECNLQINSFFNINQLLPLIIRAIMI
ncbi:MAG: radical SAM protein [Elusimicrobiota bacterium]